jgi:hypothetical protein
VRGIPTSYSFLFLMLMFGARVRVRVRVSLILGLRLRPCCLCVFERGQEHEQGEIKGSSIACLVLRRYPRASHHAWNSSFSDGTREELECLSVATTAGIGLVSPGMASVSEFFSSFLPQTLFSYYYCDIPKLQQKPNVHCV